MTNSCRNPGKVPLELALQRPEWGDLGGVGQIADGGVHGSAALEQLADEMGREVPATRSYHHEFIGALAFNRRAGSPLANRRTRHAHR